ncbi:MAG: hypothetical protein AAF449_00590 [Myxococcota bacterium]
MANDDLITLGRPERSLPQDLLHNPGGFVWWYVDALDEDLNGIVAIWSFGLPFLPGYLQAARDGRPETPAAHPSLNIALYRRGRPCFYLLQHYASQDAEWRDNYWRFGNTEITRRQSEDIRTVTASINCAIPRSQYRLQGELSVAGPIPRLSPELESVPNPRHEWCPVTGPARCTAELQWSPDASFSLDAPAYHDRNGGDRPLDQLGIDHWIWGRTVGPGGTRIHYLVWPKGDDQQAETWLFDIAPDGLITRRSMSEPAVEGQTRAWFGVPYWRNVHLGGQGNIRTGRIVEDGPFYLRSINAGTDPAGNPAAGWGEWIRPDRIDLHAHRPLVRMRVHRPHDRNSVWLPLFVGPRSTRIRRLLGVGG